MTGWHRYWAIWAAVMFLTFAIPEAIALITTQGRGTLSVAFWQLEGLEPGQPLDKWGSAHVLIGGFLTLVLIWLIGHLVLGIWTYWKN